MQETFSSLFTVPVLLALVTGAGLFACALGLGLAARKFWFPAALRLALKRNNRGLSVFLEAFRRPVVYIILLCGTLLALSVLPFSFLKTASFLTLQKRVGNIAFITLFAWGLCVVSALVPRLVQSLGGKLELGTGKTVSKFLKGICQGVIVLFAGVMILSELNYDVNGLIAGLGLGGLTIALAAKDAAANLFGGLTIIMERPFEIGDWVNASGLEGTVEDITLRSTKIRTLTNALTVVPNSQLCAAPITNWTRTEMRLAKFTVGVPYGTPPAALQALLEDFRTMLEAHEGVRTDTVQVRLADFSPSSMDIGVQFYTHTTELPQFRIVREDVYFQILALMARRDIHFAYPTQTLHVKPDANHASQ